MKKQSDISKEPSEVDEESVFINDIKEGDLVHFFDGATATVKDNRKGLIRMVSMKNLNGFYDISSCYAFEWEFVEKKGTQEKKKVLLSERQKNQALEIKQLFVF